MSRFHRLNCITISEDITLVAAGFSESFIKVWHLKGQLLQSKYEKDANQSGTKYKKLIGHAGPVYGVSFSHDNQYLISCSEDQTGKIISYVKKKKKKQVNHGPNAINSATVESGYIY